MGISETSVTKKFILFLIRAYQESFFFHSPILKALFLSDAACRFQPTCSEYTYQVIERYGIMRGVWRGLKRIMKCHPWSKGGWDPVPIQNLKCKKQNYSSKFKDF